MEKISCLRQESNQYVHVSERITLPAHTQVGRAERWYMYLEGVVSICSLQSEPVCPFVSLRYNHIHHVYLQTAQVLRE